MDLQTMAVKITMQLSGNIFSNNFDSLVTQIIIRRIYAACGDRFIVSVNLIRVHRSINWYSTDTVRGSHNNNNNNNNK